MSRVNVYPAKDSIKHDLSFRGCYCEPSVMDIGVDGDGEPARVFVHNRIGKQKNKFYLLKK